MSAATVLDTLSSLPGNTPVLLGDSEDVTAAALLEGAEVLAQRLGHVNVLGVLADNSPAWVLADLAALQAGIPHLPLPGFFNPAQLAHALRETSANTVLSDQPERIEALELGFERIALWQGLTLLQRKVRPVSLPSGTAKISFTSGSTGSPKGVCLSAAGLIETAQALAEVFKPASLQRHLAVLPLALLLENIAGIYAPLLLGAQIRLTSLPRLGWRGMAGFDPAGLHTAVAQTHPDSLILVPELLKAWVLFLEATGQRPPCALQFVAVGGAHVAPDLLARATRLGIPVYQGYGLTECGSVVCMNRPDNHDSRGGGVGRPLPHVEVTIEAGEVCVKARAFLGYLHDAASASAHPAGALFHTGDLGQFDESGNLHLNGRRKNLLITSFGRNVSPEWVEATLLAQPAIAQAIVSGEGQPTLTAVLVPASGASHDDLTAAVGQANRHLPEYARLAAWLTSAPFSTQNGQLTGNGRPVRSAILAHHSAALAALHSGKEHHHELL